MPKGKGGGLRCGQRGLREMEMEMEVEMKMQMQMVSEWSVNATKNWSKQKK